ncbi:MAG: hypothetical protein JW820_10575, partial [Spirochaetales bacterium]|nr:hypothetical protein [Spirochaetales bacterium]
MCTTHDIDILLRKKDWERVVPLLEDRFDIRLDHAEDRENGVPVDVLFCGDDSDMVVPLPEPAEVAEFDQELGANFLGLGRLLELKTAVYLAKKRGEGIELAAKDLADVVELLRANSKRVTPGLLAELHPVIPSELERILKKLRRGRYGRCGGRLRA